MQRATLGALFLDPSFIIIFFVILGTVANILIGVSMLPQDKRKKRFKIHRSIFYFVVISYFCGLLTPLLQMSGSNT